MDPLGGDGFAGVMLLTRSHVDPVGMLKHDVKSSSSKLAPLC
jgi:hypothetical protein